MKNTLSGIFKPAKTALAFMMLFSISGAMAMEDETDAPTHECTSWMLFPDMTGNNTTILHKNRDSQTKTVYIVHGKEANRSWIGVGSKGSPCMAFNSSGLAGVMNGGEKCNDISTNKNGKSTPRQLQEIITTCDTAAQATEKLLAMLKAKDYIPREQGSIFFFADTKEGYLLEFTANYHFVQKCDTGYVARANIWHHPGLAKYALTNFRTYLIESTREFVVRSAFNDAFRKNKKVTVSDIINLSREVNNPQGAPNNRSVCCSWTNSTSTFVLDHDYPDVLSTGYLCVGHPRHTVVLPVPICLEDFPEKLTDTKWAAKSYARLKELKTRSEVPSAWLEFEKESLAKYSEALSQAKVMLKENKKADAVKLLNKTFADIWQKAEKLPGLSD